ncbi:MAG: hypothetical protein K8I60_02985 [Anaerolineae bacterium]|nr:hypothetical protein [Anaerolineae bacterium]
MMTDDFARKRKRKNDDYDWVDGELPPPPGAGWPRRLVGFSWRVIKAPFIWGGRQSWAVLRWSGRQSWAGVRFSLRVAWDATKWAVRLPIQVVRWLLGVEPPPQNRYEEIRQRVRRHYRRRNRLITHFFLFIGSNIVFWADVANRPYIYHWSDGISGAEGAAIISVFWAALLLFHFIRVRMGEAEDQEIEAALERERAWEHGQPVTEHYETEVEYGSRLRDDAELVEWEDEPVIREKAKRR